MTGPTLARYRGDGFELRDVHPFDPAESRRRIDWLVSARQANDTLWVRGTYANGEAVAVLILDSRDDVGPNLSTWGGFIAQRPDESTSLDLARHAAASIARRLIEVGDRVGLVDLASGRRLLMPATGQRHLSRLTYALAVCAPIGPPRLQVRPPRVPTDAIVYFFSTLLDDTPVKLVKALVTIGHPVVVIDTLPVVRPAAGVGMELARRIVELERQDRIRALTSQQVPVIAWAGTARDSASKHLAARYRQSRRGLR